MMTRNENPVLHSADAELSIWALSITLGDIQKKIDALTKANRNAEDCLTLHDIRTKLDSANEAAERITHWFGDLELFARANPIIHKMNSKTGR